MTNSVTWDDLVRVIRGLSDCQYGPPVRGNFYIADNAALTSINACINSEPETHLRLVNDEIQNSLGIGQTVTLEVSPRLGFGLITLNVGTLLHAQYARIKEPSRFFLIEDSISNVDQVENDHLLAKYRAVLDFIQTLKRTAAFLDQDEPSLVFINNGKFEIPIDYNEEDLYALPISVLHELTNILPGGTHEKQCEAIMAEAVVDMTQHLPSYNRFRYLLTHLQDIKKRYEDGYKLFASGFSYEKVRDQVEAARVEYTGKIHKVFSDIQNQLLAIPVATIVVATQMKDAKIIGYEFWVNTAVLSGCWVFAILMVFLLHNQSLTLAVLRDEINRQKRQLEKEFVSIADSFSKTFESLSRRVCIQWIILRVIDGFVVLGLLLSHLVYFKLTPPAHDWLIHQLPWLSKFL
jgi:hypothetical protein